MFRLDKYIVSFVSILLGSLCLSALVSAETKKSLQTHMQGLQQFAMQIQADINKLERDVLFPPLLRTDLYLAVKTNAKNADNFSVKQVLVEIDTVEAIDYWYGINQSNALLKGDKQLLWQGNIAFGEHRVKVNYQLVNKRGKAIAGEKSFTFTKKSEQQPLLLNIVYEDGNTPSVSLSPIRQ